MGAGSGGDGTRPAGRRVRDLLLVRIGDELGTAVVDNRLASADARGQLLVEIADVAGQFFGVVRIVLVRQGKWPAGGCPVGLNLCEAFLFPQFLRFVAYAACRTGFAR